MGFKQYPRGVIHLSINGHEGELGMALLVPYLLVS
jgi:hypothetical protein